MPGLIKYTPVDFTKIEKADFVSFDDADYIRRMEYLKRQQQFTPSQIRRKQEIDEYPEEVKKLTEIWTNKKCFHCSKFYSGGRCYGGYDGYSPNNTNPNHNAELCEYFKLSTRYSRENMPHLNLHDSNIEYYLHEIGLINKPEKKQIGANAKQLEIDFKKKLKEKNNEIETIEKLFKIYHLDGRITFRIPDVVFKLKEKYSIVEYKSESYYGDIQQLKDYDHLFYIATNTKPNFLYWVIKRSWNIEEVKLKKSDGTINIFTEEEFLKHIATSKGLDEWM